ncbi:hypothetical protein MMC19_001505 [Ptychographa xylographoides]|nr:hypothetical protein [Ptychographa xylographoides]
MTSTRIPALLSPYLAFPEEASLVLLSGVLGASTNWLVLRFLAAALATCEQGHATHDGDPETVVVTLSFLREWTFWRVEAGRVGVDLARALKTRRFTFLDGLSHLFSESSSPRTVVPDGLHSLYDPTLKSIEKEVLAVIKDIKQSGKGERSKKIVLVIDGLDLCLAVTGQSAQDVRDMLEEWREHVHSTVLTASADSPLIHSTSTPLESNHAAFVTGLAHEARLILSVRNLNTGIAKDVSGVIRVTRGGTWDGRAGDAGGRDISGQAEEIQEKEMLFFVGGDGGVKVWER